MAMVGSITRGEIMGTPGTKITWTDSEKESAHNNEDAINEDVIIDYKDMVSDNVFKGEYPFDTILEGIESQFVDYINMEDKNNYLDIFYTQLHKSYEEVRADEEEEHPVEIIDALNELNKKFVDTVVELFDKRLTLHFPSIESETSISDNDVEFILRRSYEFFILGARDNFKTVITADIIPRVKDITDDREYFKTVNQLMEMYSPLITNIKPIDFLKYRNDLEMIELFENNQIVGNFLRKYTPKLFQNDEYMVVIINHITMIQQFKMDIVDSAENFEKSNVSPETKMVVGKATDDYYNTTNSPNDEANSDSEPEASL